MTETCCGGSSSLEQEPNGGHEIAIRLDDQRRLVSLVIDGHSVNLDGPVPDGLKQFATTATQADPLTQASPDTKSREIDHRERLFVHLRNTVVTFFAVILAQVLIARVWVADSVSWSDRYGLWILYLDVSVVALMATVFYMRSYVYGRVTHMIGMLIGMTIGMQVGTMVGGVLGATNGFFVGAMIGMGLGSCCGVLTAWCCGPMAVLHALMSGVMGGTMGAMVVVMMMPDHVLVFMPVFTALNIMILICFTYIFYRECVLDAHCVSRHNLRFVPLLFTGLLMTLGLSLLIISGPKGLMGGEAASEGEAANPFSVNPHDHSGSHHPPEMGCGSGMEHSHHNH